MCQRLGRVACLARLRRVGGWRCFQCVEGMFPVCAAAGLRTCLPGRSGARGESGHVILPSLAPWSKPGPPGPQRLPPAARGQGC